MFGGAALRLRRRTIESARDRGSRAPRSAPNRPGGEGGRDGCARAVSQRAPVRARHGYRRVQHPTNAECPCWLGLARLAASAGPGSGRSESNAERALARCRHAAR